jgi:hypothetical protein
VAAQLGGYPPTDDVDLEAERLDQPAQRADPGRVGRVQPQLVQQRLTAGAEQVADRHRRSLFGQHRVHLRLQPGPQRDQLGVSAAATSRICGRTTVDRSQADRKR